MNSVMNQKVLTLCGFALLAIVSTSCHDYEREKRVIRYKGESDSELNTMRAPEAGSWNLFEADSATPFASVTVEQGDVIGFRRDEKSGSVVAVAADETFELVAENEYYWAHATDRPPPPAD